MAEKKQRKELIAAAQERLVFLKSKIQKQVEERSDISLSLIGKTQRPSPIAYDAPLDLSILVIPDRI
jgi:hypothetical protein